MSKALIDTHRLVSDLKSDYGFNEKQAAGVAEAIKRIDMDQLVTKSDLRETELSLKVDALKWGAPMLISQMAGFAAIVQWLR